jgi:hypothetical protein
VLCTSCYNDDHCQIIQNLLQQFKSYGADTTCRLLNTWPLSLTLTLGKATTLLRHAHRLMMMMNSAKLFQFFFQLLKKSMKPTEV